MTGIARPLPDLDEKLHAPFWEGTRARELRVQECAHCYTVRWPPRTRCAACGSYDLRWRAVAPRGRLFSWTVAAHPFGAAWTDRVPYVVGIVTLDRPASVRFLGNVVGVAPGELRANLPMEAVFEAVSPTVTLVNWQPAGA